MTIPALARSSLILALACLSKGTIAAQESGTTVRGQVITILRDALTRLDSAQQRFFQAQGSRANSIWRLQHAGLWNDVPGVSAVVVEASSARWSAVATTRVLPGIHCQIFSVAGAAAETTCSGEPDFVVLTMADRTSLEMVILGANPLRPQCTRQPRTNEAGQVVFEGTVNEKGELELDNLKITASPSIVLSYAALPVITECRFHPVEIDGQKLPARRSIPLNIRGASE